MRLKRSGQDLPRPILQDENHVVFLAKIPDINSLEQQ